VSQPDLRSDSSSSGYFSPPAKPKINIYSVMLILSLLAIALGCLFLWLEIRAYEGQLSPSASAGWGDTAPGMAGQLADLPAWLCRRV